MNAVEIPEILALPAFEDNYIWLLRHGGLAVAVDPGDADPVIAHLARTGDRLAAILVTHRHHDHTGGIAELVARSPVPVYAPAEETVPAATHPVRGGERIALPELGLDIEVLAVPGHTRGHVAYYALAAPPREGVGVPPLLFCGDTLFGAGCGRVFDGTPAQLHASLARLAALPGETRVYCAHEYTLSCLAFAAQVEPDNPAIPARAAEAAARRAAGLPTVPSTLALELATNPFLRWRSPAVLAVAARQLGRAPAGDAETFAALRAWKDRA